MVAEPGSSLSSGGGVSFLWLLDHFLFDVRGGSGRNLTLGMNGICSASSKTTSCNGTYAAVSSIMGVGEGVATPYSATVFVLEIDMTILYGNSPRLS